MPGKNNTNNGQDAVFLTNTALRSRLRHKVLTRSRALSLPENTASDSHATKFVDIFDDFWKKRTQLYLIVLQVSLCRKARKLRQFGKIRIVLVWHQSMPRISILSTFPSKIGNISSISSLVSP